MFFTYLNEFAMENVYMEKVIGVLEKITKKKFDNIELQGSLKDQFSIDSIQVVEFFAALENEFQVELPLQLMTVKTAGEFIQLLINEVESNKMD